MSPSTQKSIKIKIRREREIIAPVKKKMRGFYACVGISCILHHILHGAGIAHLFFIATKRIDALELEELSLSYQYFDAPNQ